MKYLFDALTQMKDDIFSQGLFLFLDYDGTLTPIAADPSRAILPPRTRKLLEAISHLPSCKLAVISGRALEDVRGLVGLKGITYIGNHGFEIKGPDLEFESLIPPAFKGLLGYFKKEIEKKLIGSPGSFIEDKKLTMSIHYRNVSEGQAQALERLLRKMTKPYIVKKEFRATWGKKVLEIRPPIEWDKGKAVLWVLRKEEQRRGKRKVLPVYIGDDTTDEDAFVVLKGRGICVCVGDPRSSRAPYYLKDPNEVIKFLQFLYEVKNNGPAPRP